MASIGKRKREAAPASTGGVYADDELESESPAASSGEEEEEVKDSKKSNEKKSQRQKTTKDKSSTSVSTVPRTTNAEGKPEWEIGSLRKVSLNEWRKAVRVDIREFYKTNTGEVKPGRKGISLTKEQWETLKSIIPDIDAAIAEM
ncbi:Activated RNA polymerase II transcriptional coactivator p15 [Balamuthia mandrillaris]